ncbi:MAG: hypothetical protein K6G63_09235 [Eubacterium sp.]|nr:hypothetical protein [Eubacterium sp.]
MSAKRWCISFLCIMLAVLVAIMGINVVIDPYCYFKAQSGDNYTLDEDDYLRELKAQHIKHFSDKYDAYLIGGSKAGALRTEELKKIDGYNYYNCWVMSGNFQDYEAYTKYICEHTNAKKILLQISTTEIKQFDREYRGAVFETPAILTGESKVAEMTTFLFKNLKLSYEKITDKDPKYPCFETGERNLTKYYKYFNENKGTDKYYDFLMKKQVDKFYKDFKRGIKDRSDVIKQCVDSLKRIKSMCKKHNVELQIFFGSIFAGQMVAFESDCFYNFLRQVVEIGDKVWCFNTFNDIALNYYNYYDPSHYYKEVGDLMIDTMAGEPCKYSDFGILLTRDNVDEHIASRRRKLAEWKAFFDEHGTLPYKSLDDPSLVPKIYDK